LTRGSQRAEPSEPLESLTDDELDELDEALLAFVSTPALSADHLLVVAHSPAGDVVLQDRQTAEAKRRPELLTQAISAAAERWADNEKRTVRFRAAWCRGDRTLATYAWECGQGEAKQELDGSVTSFLQQAQTNQQSFHKLHLEGFEMMQEGWRSLLNLQNKRIEALERDNQELRDRLRKLDDVGSEMAIEQMRAELAQRGRTTDLLEKRVLPIAQAVAVRYLEQQSATAGASSENENSQDKERRADA
jgi:hypothetical protein